MPATSLVIDTDTASDDAIALIIAARSAATVRAITVVGGNVPLPQAVRNAQVTLEIVGLSGVPLHRGLPHPLLRPLETAQEAHGEDGMSGVPFPEPSYPVAEAHAVAALLDIAAHEPGRHHLVTLGPLSNIAAALFIDPDLLTRFTRTTMMIGAADNRGNIAPTGEFNAWVDPEAAAVVFAAPGRKEMVGWDASRQYAVITPEDEAHLRTLGPLGVLTADVNGVYRDFCREVTGVPGYDLPDPLAMAVALHPELVTERQHLHMTVATDAVTRGQTFPDRRPASPPPNLEVITAVDSDAFKQVLFTSVGDEP
ncbi:MAG: nucleoside hydrolase [Klenkia sp.]|nr:nucleoside hydrolase [Klenkia sp.]